MLSITRIVPVSFRHLIRCVPVKVNKSATKNLSTFNRHHQIMSLPPPLTATCTRKLSVQSITKRIKLIREDEQKAQKEPKSSKRPLALIITWLLARPKQQMKFVQLYIDQGFDVLLMDTVPIDIIWPTSGSQKVTRELLEYLLKNEGKYEKMVLHGFSAGGYTWGECINHWQNNQAKYQPVMDRIVAQTWDSIAGMTEVPIGVSQSVFPHNAFLRKALQNLIFTYMKVFYSSSTRHYKRSSDIFGVGLLRAPGLFIVSKTDLIGTEATSRGFVDNWKKKGIKVSMKCFDSSPHVGHFVQHREEYLECLYDHLDAENMLKFRENIKAKL